MVNDDLQKKLRLVPSAPEYAELWWRWRHESNTKAYNPLAVASVEQLRKRLGDSSSDLNKWQTEKELMQFIEWQGQVIGTLSLKNVSVSMGYGEIGYGIAQNFQGLGLGKAAVTAFVDDIFQKTLLRRLIALVAESNLASCRLLTTLGFQREGLLREHFLINSKPTNQICFGLLKSEWDAQANRS